MNVIFYVQNKNKNKNDTKSMKKLNTRDMKNFGSCSPEIEQTAFARCVAGLIPVKVLSSF